MIPRGQLRGYAGAVVPTSRRLLNPFMTAEVYRLSSSQSGQSLGEKKAALSLLFDFKGLPLVFHRRLSTVPLAALFFVA